MNILDAFRKLQQGKPKLKGDEMQKPDFAIRLTERCFLYIMPNMIAKTIDVSIRLTVEGEEGFKLIAELRDMPLGLLSTYTHAFAMTERLIIENTDKRAAYN